jgi:hypothetical protein
MIFLVIIRNKVKSSLCLINCGLRHEDGWGSGGIALRYLTSALDGGEWSASCPGRFTLGKFPRYPLDRRLGGPKSRPGRFGDEKDLLPLPESNPGRPARSPSLYRASSPGSHFFVIIIRNKNTKNNCHNLHSLLLLLHILIARGPLHLALAVIP